MEKIIMNRSMYKEIPIWRWGDLKLVRLGKGTFITLKPPKTSGIRRLNQAKEFAVEFAEKHGCQVTVSYDTEWEELYNFLKVNFAIKNFVELNKLEWNEALLLNSETNGESHILASGIQSRSIGELYHGFISGEDADGEPQTNKILFLTLRFDPNCIVIE